MPPRARCLPDRGRQWPGAHTQGCQRRSPVPVPAFEIPVGGEKRFGSGSVRDGCVTAPAHRIYPAPRHSYPNCAIGGLALVAASETAITIAGSEECPRATRAVAGRLRGGPRVRPLPAAPDAHHGRVRRRKCRRRPDVHRRGAGRQRGSDGAAVRRPSREAARQAARRDLAGPERGVYLQHPQMPPAGQPRPASERDRVVPGLPVASGRPDRADGDLHARELLDQAAPRGQHRDLAAARPRGGADHRAARRPPVPALPPGGGAVYALYARGAPRRLPPDSRSAGARAA